MSQLKKIVSINLSLPLEDTFLHESKASRTYMGISNFLIQEKLIQEKNAVSKLMDVQEDVPAPQLMELSLHHL